MRISIFFLFFSLLAGALNGQNRHWQDIAETQISRSVMDARTLIPEKARSVQFDFEDLQRSLRDAPMEVIGRKNSSELLLNIPMPDGTDLNFRMEESPSMEKEISARYPNIKTYRGIGVEKRGVMRLVLSPLGIHGSIVLNEGQVYLDPYAMGEKSFVQSYYIRDYSAEGHPELTMGCGVSGDNHDLTEEYLEFINSPEGQRAPRSGEAVTERLYRMAIAGTGEWTASHYGASLENGLAAMNIGMARMNSIWEREFAIRGILIDDEDKLIFTAPGTDPYTQANSGYALLGQNTSVINAIIPAGSYDFGHVFTAGCNDVGGVANLGVVCGGNKAGGVSCHWSSNMNSIIVNLVGHEMGHQLTGNHTFNNCGPDNVSTGNAYEPGGGTTIMSYAGSCGSNNVQGGADDYYHSNTLSEVHQFTTMGNANTCPQKIPTDNIRPEVTFPYEDGFYIPISTPFFLEAIGEDENGDELLYNFEQFDRGPLSELGTPLGNAPLFRSLYPNEDNFRYFPALQSVITNTSNIREVLPTISRNMTFRVNVRDYNETIGTSNWDEVAFFATDEAGPFLVSYPDIPETFESGQDLEVTWDVANTDGEKVNCQRVNILLSTNGGFTFDMVLAEDVPNDGSHKVVIPDVVTSTARIKIEANDNVFYDMSNANFSIEAPSAPSFNFTAAPFIQKSCLPIVQDVEVNSIAVLGYNSPITLDVLGLPAGATVSYSSNPVMPSESATASFDFTNVNLTDLVTMTLRGISADEDTVTQEILFDMYSNDFSDLVLSTPTLNQSGVSEVPEYSWDQSMNAETYTIQVSSSPSFAEGTIFETVTGLTETTYPSGVLLPKNTPIFWRVSAENTCGAGDFSEIFVFHTETLACFAEDLYDESFILPLSPSVNESVITFFDDGEINDLNVANIEIGYSPVVSLRLTLVGPDGTSAILMDKECGGTSQVNLGYDDQAPGLLPCPANTGLRYKPVEPLSVFNGKNVKGDWTLRVETTIAAFNAGQFSGWKLEVCSNTSPSGPELINNEILPVKTADAQVIESSYLLATDADNTSNELTYTLIDGLAHGELQLNGNILKAGNTWTQNHIDGNNLIYYHNGDDAVEDFFHFIITDGDGGFVGKTKFQIDIDENNAVLNTESVGELNFRLFPNPTSDELFIEFIDEVSPENRIVIQDIQGRRLFSQVLGSSAQSTSLNVEELLPGFYFLVIYDDEVAVGTHKLIIQR